MTDPNVSLIILNWNGKDDTLECLSSVFNTDYPNYQVIVVDNGSIDGSVEAISTQYPDTVLIKTGANLGYAGGNNAGIQWALDHGSDYIFILNNDTIISSDLLKVFVNSAKSLPKGSVLGAKIYFYDRPKVLWFAGGRWLSEKNCFEHIDYGQQDETSFNEISQVDYITGCALFSESNTFRDVGLLDDNFFLTYEETDWCYRAKAKGYSCFVIPEAKLWHKVSASFGGKNSPIVVYFMTRNKLLWARKHLPFLVRLNTHKESLMFLLRTLFPPINVTKTNTPFLKQLYWSFSTWLKEKKENQAIIKATLIGLFDYYLGRFGDCPEKIRKLGK